MNSRPSGAARKAMEVLLQETREEYESTLEMSLEVKLVPLRIP